MSDDLSGIVALDDDGVPPVPEALAEWWDEATATTATETALKGLRWRLAGLSWREAARRVGLHHSSLLQAAHRTNLYPRLIANESLLGLQRMKIHEADMEIVRRLQDPEKLDKASLTELNMISGTATDKVFGASRIGFGEETPQDSPFHQLARLLAESGTKVTVTLEPADTTIDVTPDTDA